VDKTASLKASSEVVSQEPQDYDILLFHEESMIAGLFEKVLTYEGYRVDRAESAEAFIEKASHNSYCCAIYDETPFKTFKGLVDDVLNEKKIHPFYFCKDRQRAQSDERFVHEVGGTRQIKDKIARFMKKKEA